jgi:NADH-quinone oxidoreductase subunit D
VVGKEDAINWGLTGPLARASGVRRDLRKDEPYLCYADNWDGNGSSAVDFKVPVSDLGDVLRAVPGAARGDAQSLAIVDQLVENIPAGPINILPDEKTDAAGQGRGLFQHRRVDPSLRAGDDQPRFHSPPVGEAYGANETANGELGFYLVSDGGERPYRARCRPPCFMNYQCFPQLVVGHQISDVIAVLGSMNIIAAELDR